MAYRRVTESLEAESAGDLPQPGMAEVGDPAATLRVVAGSAEAAQAIPLAPAAVAATVAPAATAQTGSVPSAPVDDLYQRIADALKAIESKDYAAAALALDAEALPANAGMDIALEWAETLAKANLAERSDEVFERLLVRFPNARKVHFLYAKRLFLRGLAARAAYLVETTDAFPHGSSQMAFVDRVHHLRDMLSAREDRQLAMDEDCRLLAMKHAIAAFEGRTLRSQEPGRLGRLTMLTGSLGPGGAERQLSRTAAELELIRRREGHIGGIPIDKPIEVIVRAHDSEQQRDFYLSDLVAADVELHEINPMPAQPTAALGVDDPDLAALLDYLPSKVNFGVRRLVTHFRKSQPDVVSMWQDGACLLAGLAALVAGVPKIQVMIRGLPPIIRQHMFQPDYEVLYRALAAVPGVEFVSNSKSAALAYATWLELPIERFSIVYNGVQRMECQPTAALDAVWQDFCDRTPGGGPVIGGVFRFDTDKRPITWIRFAARYAKRHPDARFVLVGDGRLFADSVRVATELGVVDRILFVGRSTDVGYWMKKMNVLVLMSSFEGLPNVLIEAQYLGVPVVSTPAGGASECFVEGVTGHILGSADKTDLEEACDKVHALIDRAQDEAIFGPATRDFLEPNFSVPRMLENFVRKACDAPHV